MSDLLSTGAISDIKAVLKQVTDTFSKTPVVYRRYGEVMNRFNEDRDKDAPISTHSILGMVQYAGAVRMSVESEHVEGSQESNDVKITVNFADMVAAGLADGDLVICRVETDWMEVDGVNYNVHTVAYDGFLDATPILVLLMGDIVPKRT